MFGLHSKRLYFSQPYKTTNKIIILYIFIFSILESTLMQEVNLFLIRLTLQLYKPLSKSFMRLELQQSQMDKKEVIAIDV
jgi:hypothetical protein